MVNIQNILYIPEKRIFIEAYNFAIGIMLI